MGEDEALLIPRARGDGGCAGIRHSVACEEAAEEINEEGTDRQYYKRSRRHEVL